MREIATWACVGAICLFSAGCANAKGGNPGWRAFYHWPLSAADSVKPSFRQPYLHNRPWAAPRGR